YSIETSNITTPGIVAISNSEFKDNISARGKFKPYLGMKTMERRVGKQYDVIKTSSIDELKKLVLLGTAAQFDAGGKRLLNVITNSRTRYPLKQLCRVFPTTIGGIVAHRYEMFDSNSTIIGPVGNPMLASTITFNTSHIPGLSGSKKDYPVAFQQYFSYSIGAIRVLALEGSTSRSLNIQLSVDELPQLVQSDLQFRSADVKAIKTFPGNPLIYVSDIVLKRESLIDMPRMVRDQYYLDITRLFNKPSNAQVCLRSLIIYLAKTVAASKSLDDESGEFIKATTGTLRLDVTLTENFAVSSVVDATIEAVIILVVFTLISQIKEFPIRFKTLIDEIDKWTDFVVLTWEDLIRQSPKFVKQLIRSGLWTQPIGQSSFTYSSFGLRKLISSRIMQLMFNIQFLSEISEPVLFLQKSRTLTSMDIDIMNSSLLIWKDYVSLYADTDKLPRSFSIGFIRGRELSPNDLKRTKHMDSFEFLTTRKNILYNAERSLDPQAIPRDYIIMKLKFNLGASTRSFNFDSIEQALLNKGLLSVEISEEELQRWLENIRSSFNTRTKRLPSLLIPDRILVNLPNLNRQSQYQIDDIVWRFRCRIGVHSTAAYKWSPIISVIKYKSKNPRVAVIGTGAGGIQAALSILGIRSFGFDLQSTIPVEFLGDFSYRPVEIDPEDELANFPAVSHITSGDIFDNNVLQQILRCSNYDYILIDIESKMKRFGFEVVEQLVNCGYRGWIGVKFFLTSLEAKTMYATLKSISTNCYVHHPIGRPAIDVPKPSIFLLNLKPSLLLTDTVDLDYQLDYIPRGPDDMRFEPRYLNWADDRPKLIKILTSRSSVATIEGDILFVRAMLRSLVEATIKYPVTSKNYFDLCCLTVLDMVEPLVVKIERHRLTSETQLGQELLTLLNSPLPTRVAIPGSNRQYSVISSHGWMRQMLLKIVPRYLSYLLSTKQGERGD
ncbi:hypothetical protein, partial, partial [Parasitella parasitica]